MSKLATITLCLGLSACGLTGVDKIDSVANKALTELQCRAVAVAPAAQYLTGDIAEQVLKGKIDLPSLLETLEVSPDVVEQVAQALKACDKP